MGKRSNFERIDKDFYRTIDPKAVEILVKHLDEGTRFIEPCAGAGDLIEQLEQHSCRCIEAWDIEPKADGIIEANALKEFANGMRADCYITNPPWSRPDLHRLIDHLSSQMPTWLLFDSDWAYTEQELMARKHGVKPATELMKHCRKVVAVGRLLWIPRTTMKGKENCSWYLFDQNSEGQTAFYGRQAA